MKYKNLMKNYQKRKSLKKIKLSKKNINYGNKEILSN